MKHKNFIEHLQIGKLFDDFHWSIEEPDENGCNYLVFSLLKGQLLLGCTTPVSRFQICLLQCSIINIIDIVSIVCSTMNIKIQKIQDSTHPSNINTTYSFQFHGFHHSVMFFLYPVILSWHFLLFCIHILNNTTSENNMLNSSLLFFQSLPCSLFSLSFSISPRVGGDFPTVQNGGKYLNRWNAFWELTQSTPNKQMFAKRIPVE